MKHAIHAGLWLAALAAFVVPALAQEGDAGAGLTLAQGACATCHAIRPGQQSTNASAPAFDKVANVPGMTAIALQASLQTSHRSMPNLILSTEDRRNVAAYILSLKAK
jgi:mono/diheme cytochrome c family protein